MLLLHCTTLGLLNLNPPSLLFCTSCVREPVGLKHWCILKSQFPACTQSKWGHPLVQLWQHRLWKSATTELGKCFFPFPFFSPVPLLPLKIKMQIFDFLNVLAPQLSKEHSLAGLLPSEKVFVWDYQARFLPPVPVEHVKTAMTSYTMFFCYSKSNKFYVFSPKIFPPTLW